MSTGNMAANWRQANDVIAPGWLTQACCTPAGVVGGDLTAVLQRFAHSTEELRRVDLTFHEFTRVSTAGGRRWSGNVR